MLPAVASLIKLRGASDAESRTLGTRRRNCSPCSWPPMASRGCQGDITPTSETGSQGFGTGSR